MKISIITATGLLVAAGAAAVGAATRDIAGSGANGQGLGGVFTLSGSDTLKPVIQQVITATTFTGGGFNYVGGGQSVSDAALVANTQQLSFGTASLKATSYIGISIDVDGAGTLLPVQGTTEALVLGLDGLSILGNVSGVPAAPAALVAEPLPADPSTNPKIGLAVAGKTFVVNGHNADGSENTSLAPTFPGSATGANANYGAFLDTDGKWKYTLQSSIDVIRLIYGGLHHNGTGGIGDFNANSDVRRSLANQWEAIFNTDTAVSGTKQLNHAYRRSDLAGTTNAFIALVGFGNRGIGTLTGSGSANKKTSPFANDAAAAGLQVGNANGAITLTTPASVQVTYGPTTTAATNLAAARNDVNSTVVNNAGSGDQLDLDPIRRPAAHSGTKSIDQVASTGGTLGLVLPIFYPDTPNITTAQAYPTILADPGSFDPLPAGPNGFDTSPAGDTLNSQYYQPYWLADGSGVTGGTVATHHQQLDATGLHFVTVNVPNAKGVRTPDLDIAVIDDGLPTIHLATVPDKFYKHHYNAISKLNNVPTTAYSTDDGRAYNSPVRNDDTGAYVRDANNRELAAGFYKIRSLGQPVPANNGAFLPYTPNLQQTTSDFQTGALVANDPQSIGFTGRGVDTNPSGSAFNTAIKALWLSGSAAATPPFVPGLSTPPFDQNVLNLIVNSDGSLHGAPLDSARGAAVYPLARRTYLATLVGFTANAAPSDGGSAVRGLKGDEALLASAFGNSDNTAAAFLANGFVPLPHKSQYIGSTPQPSGNGGVFAVDYPENNLDAPTASFLATGPAATHGGANRDATVASPPVIVPYSSP